MKTCPVCGSRNTMNHVTIDVPYTYKGEATTIHDVRGFLCSSCHEQILDEQDSSLVSAAMLEFNRDVNARQVDPFFITRVRKKLRLNQGEAAEIFGGGANAFSRYENGKTKPPVSLLKLLAVLEKHPDLLEEVRTASYQ